MPSADEATGFLNDWLHPWNAIGFGTFFVLNNTLLGIVTETS